MSDLMKRAAAAREKDLLDSANAPQTQGHFDRFILMELEALNKAFDITLRNGIVPLSHKNIEVMQILNEEVKNEIKIRKESKT